MKLAIKPAAAKPVTDFDALSAATEFRQRNEPREKQIERANREAHRTFIENHAIAEHEEIRKRGNSAKGIRMAKQLAKLKRDAVVAFWPKAYEKHPKNKTKRIKLIVRHLAKRKAGTKSLKISVSYLVNAILPAVRSRLVPRY